MGGKGVMRVEELERLRFYPLDTSLPSIVMLYLQAKEVELLIYRLQQSLDQKMDKELTKSVGARARENILKEDQADKDMEKNFQDIGLVRLPNGQYVNNEEWEQREKGVKRAEWEKREHGEQ